MADRSPIEWTQATWNPVRGCTRVSPGCGGPGRAGGCYAEVMAARFSKPGQWGHGFAEMVKRPDGSTAYRWTGKVALIESQLMLPLSWREPRTIFVNSTSDLFHEDLTDEAIDRVFAFMALAPQHTYQVLTKRSARMRAYLCAPDVARRIYDLVCDLALEEVPVVLMAPGVADPDIMSHLPRVHLGTWPLGNVWLGVSVEDQPRADERIPDLLATPAALRFISAEPLLGPVDLTSLPAELISTDECGAEDCCGGHLRLNALDNSTRWCDAGAAAGMQSEPVTASSLDWVIAGGESGPTARPMHPDWARSLRDQCQAAGVPFFFKQWGSWAHSEQKPVPVPGPSFFDAEGAPLGDGWHFWTEGDSVTDASIRVGKKAAGRLLDGLAHDAMPQAREVPAL